MSAWHFTTRVCVYDDHPLLECLLEYAEIEVDVEINCDLYFGFDGSEYEPPEDPAASLESVQASDLIITPHDPSDEEGEIKALFLMTPEMKDQIERMAVKKVEDEWEWKYSKEAFKTHEDFHSYWDPD